MEGGKTTKKKKKSAFTGKDKQNKHPPPSTKKKKSAPKKKRSKYIDHVVSLVTLYCNLSILTFTHTPYLNCTYYRGV